jgi:hypothetical protein
VWVTNKSIEVNKFYSWNNFVNFMQSTQTFTWITRQYHVFFLQSMTSNYWLSWGVFWHLEAMKSLFTIAFYPHKHKEPCNYWWFDPIKPKLGPISTKLGTLLLPYFKLMFGIFLSKYFFWKKKKFKIWFCNIFNFHF